MLSGPGAQAKNPEESGLFGSFADLFALTLAAPQAAPAVKGEGVVHAADGNALPDETGKELPLAVAALPLAAQPVAMPSDGEDPPPPQNVPPVLRSVPSPYEPAATFLVLPDAKPSEARALHAVAPKDEAEPSPLSRSEAHVPSARSPAPAELALAAGHTVALALRPATTGTAAKIGLSGSDGAQPPAAEALNVSDEATRKPIAAEKVARFIPVAQLLRPVATSSPAPVMETAADAAPEHRSQSVSPAAPSSTVPAPLVQTAVVPSGETARPIATASLPDAAPAPQRHDFGQVVEKLAEARELARPARAEMQVSHREFGTVSMQFDVTGGALKVALASAHAGFAPAVQAALAERPVAASTEAARVEVANHQQAQTSVQASTSAQSATGHSHGDNAQHQQGRQHETPRAPGVQPNRGEQAETAERSAPQRRPTGRDAALFA